MFLHQFAKLQCNAKIHIFFHCVVAHRPDIFPPCPASMTNTKSFATALTQNAATNTDKSNVLKNLDFIFSISLQKYDFLSNYRITHLD